MLLRKGAYLPGTTQNFTTSGSSQVSSAFGSSTSVIRVAVLADTYIALGGSSITATTSSMLIPAGKVELIAVGLGTGSTYIAFLQVSAAGRISITELA
jgi:hypothetical protein